MKSVRTRLRTAIFGLTTACLAAAAPVRAAGDEARCGRLDNGLTYYIRHVGTQPGVAGFYLVQNVGSLMEEDNQKGLAHFLEHMAFNASHHFPGRIDRFLQRRGLVHYNAYTAQDETVYAIDDVPADDRPLMDSCLLVLRDWCHFLTLPEEGIEKERGIVLEEWRMRRDAVARARERIVEALYNGSRYASREAIGDREVLETFGRAELAAYYDRWYRPDLQAVIAVGDFDAAHVEAFVRSRFADIPAASSAAPPRPRYAIAPRREPAYVKVVDPELEGVAMEFTQRIERPAPAATPEEVLRRIVIRDCFNRMLETRLAALSVDDDPAILSAGIEYGPLLRGYDALTMSIRPYPGRDFRALYEVFRIWETVRRLGFTPREFELQMRQQLRQAEALERNVGRADYETYAMLYQAHFLQGVPVVEPAERGALLRKVLAGLTLGDLNGWIGSWASTDDNRVFVVSGSDPDYDYPSLGTILDAEADVRDEEPEQPIFTGDTVSLIDFRLEPAPIVRSRRLPVGDAAEWTFANGARVVFKSADAGAGRFRLTAFSEGGLSLVADEDLPSARAIEPLAFASGVYRTDRSAMIPLMRNHDIEIAFRLGERQEIISGEALCNEADRFFELLHLGLTHPRFDEPEFARYTNGLLLSLATRKADAMDRVADTLRMLLSVPSPRSAVVDSAYVGRMELDRVKRIFRERFCAPEEFVFFLAGDLSEAEARDYAARYIGTLPASGRRRERAVAHPSTVRAVSLSRTFDIERPDGKARVDISFSNDLKFNRRQRMAFWLGGTVLNSRCKEEIRERRGGTYDIGVSTRYDAYADPRERLTVRFETGSDRVDEMKKAFYEEWEYLLREGVTPEDVRSIVGARKQQIASQPRDTGFWIGALYGYIRRGEDVTRPGYETRNLDRMTPRKVRRVMRRFGRGARSTDIVIRAVSRSDTANTKEPGV